MPRTRKKNAGYEQYKMETDMPGLLTLLADHLYSDADVFIRELLQNAHDALVMRRRQKPTLAGHISLQVDSSAGTITVSDNGVGMDRDDIRRFLSVIGSSSKRGKAGVEELRKLAGEELIGQFGIGMLSSFVVASSVEVQSRKEDTGGCRWINNGSADCSLEAWEQLDVGTKVILLIREDYGFVMEEEYLTSAIVRYGNFLPFPIYLDGHGPVNAINPPWLKNGRTPDEQACRDFIRSSYGVSALELIPVNLDGVCRARGILYITDERVPDFGTKGTVDLYVRRMFVCSEEQSLLPPWAKFVRGIIDSPDINPTAARDGIKADDPAVVLLRRQLGDLIIERLRNLAEQQPERFARLAAWHHYHLKGMACLHDDFFERIAESLPFVTNRGSMTLGKCLAETRTNQTSNAKTMLRYHSGEGSSAQFERIAEAHDWLVIDAGKGFDSELLRRFAVRNHDTVELIRLDSGDPQDLFMRLEPTQEKGFLALETAIADRMRQSGVEHLAVRTRSFSPADIPALIMRDRQDEALDELRTNLEHPGLIDAAMEIGDSLVRSRKQRVLTLTLNALNPLVARLTNLPRYQQIEETNSDSGVQLIPTLMGIIFSTALMSSGVPSGKEDADLLRMQISILGSGVLNLLERIRLEEAYIHSILSESGKKSEFKSSSTIPGSYNC